MKKSPSCLTLTSTVRSNKFFEHPQYLNLPTGIKSSIFCNEVLKERNSTSVIESFFALATGEI